MRYMNEKNDVRDGVLDADATGMIAGEELITQAETMLPLEHPALAPGDLHASLPPEHPAHATIDELHAELGKSAPDRRSIEAHVGRLRSVPELEAAIATWWESPPTQRFIANLSQIGL